RRSSDRGPNHTWDEAAAMTLGELVVGSGEEAEYVPVPGTSKNDVVSAAANEHWYRFQCSFAAADTTSFLDVPGTGTYSASSPDPTTSSPRVMAAASSHV